MSSKSVTGHMVPGSSPDGSGAPTHSVVRATTIRLVSDLARALVAASLVAAAGSALALAVALLVARRRVPVRAALATTLTFACLALAAAAAAGAIAVGVEEDLAIPAAALGLVASLSLVRAALLRREHAAMVGGVLALEEARQNARESARALSATERLSERLDREGADADVTRLLLEAARAALPGVNVALRQPGDALADGAVSVPCELDESLLLVAGPGEGAPQPRADVEATLAALAHAAELGGHRRTDALRARQSRDRHGAVTDLELRLRQADDVFGAAHATAQAAAQHLGAQWVDAGIEGTPMAAFALGGEPRVDSPAQASAPLVSVDGVLRAGLEPRRPTSTGSCCSRPSPPPSAAASPPSTSAARASAAPCAWPRCARSRPPHRPSRADAPIAIVRAVRRALDADGAVIYRLDGRTPTVVEAIGIDQPAGLDGIAAQAVATARAVVDREGGHLAAAPVADMAAGVSAPIPGVPSAAGAITVLYRDEGLAALNDDDARDLVAFAQIAAIAFVRLDLDQELDRRERLRAGFLEIAEGLIGTREPEETHVAVADAARRALRADAAVVVDDGHLDAPPGHSASLLALAAREGRAIFCADVRTDRRVPAAERTAMAEAGHRAALCVPIGPRGAGRAQAVLGMAWREPRAIADDDLELARHLATAAAAAIERAEVLSAERRARGRAQELQRIGGLIASNLDAPAVLREIVSQAAAAAGRRLRARCGWSRATGSWSAPCRATSTSCSPASGRRSPAAPRARCWPAARPLAIDDLRRRRPLAADDPLVQRASFASYLGAPILSPDGALSGVLALYDRRRRRWQPDEIAALEAFANSATVALQNALLYQQVAQEKETSPRPSSRRSPTASSWSAPTRASRCGTARRGT